VYSHGLESIAGGVSEREFIRLARRVRSSQIFTLKSKRPELNGKPAIVKEIQEQFTSTRVVHVDFQALREDESVTVNIPLRFVGEAPGVKNDGGVLSVGAHEIAVQCLPKSIPDEFVIDVSALNMGESIHARDIKLPEGVELDSDGDESVVSVIAQRVQEITAPTAAEGATAEGAAAGEGAAAAPAAGGAATPAGSTKG